jgi:hypothetical protein
MQSKWLHFEQITHLAVSADCDSSPPSLMKSRNHHQSVEDWQHLTDHWVSFYSRERQKGNTVALLRLPPTAGSENPRP